MVTSPSIGTGPPAAPWPADASDGAETVPAPCTPLSAEQPATNRHPQHNAETSGCLIRARYRGRTWHPVGAMAWLVRDGRVLASAETADSTTSRVRGLLGRLEAPGALVITRCRWVHSLGMRFDLDVAYLDETGAVIKIQRLRRHRVGMPVPAARQVVEAEAGAFARWDLHVGDVVELRD